MYVDWYGIRVERAHRQIEEVCQFQRSYPLQSVQQQRSNPSSTVVQEVASTVRDSRRNAPKGPEKHKELRTRVWGNIILVAKSMFSLLKTRTGQNSMIAQPFLFVLMANRAFIPLIQNWLCNTALMQGVHARTLIIFTDDGDESLKASLVVSKFPVQVVRMQLMMSPDLQKDMNFGTYGYWRLVQVRVQLVLEID